MRPRDLLFGFALGVLTCCGAAMYTVGFFVPPVQMGFGFIGLALVGFSGVLIAVAFSYPKTTQRLVRKGRLPAVRVAQLLEEDKLKLLDAGVNWIQEAACTCPASCALHSSPWSGHTTESRPVGRVDAVTPVLGRGIKFEKITLPSAPEPVIRCPT